MQKHASTGHSTGLGLGNVIRRLQLFYQCEDIYSIHSEIGKGTIDRTSITKRRIIMYRILIVDDEEIERIGLKKIITEEMGVDSLYNRRS